MTQVLKPKNYCRCGCGSEIPATRKWVSGHNLKRRPNSAIVKNGRLYKEIKCTECGKEFDRRSDQINRHGNVNLCSTECVSTYKSRTQQGVAIPSMRTGSHQKCHNCQKDIYIRKSRLKKSEKVFCNKKCQIENQKKTGVIPKNFISSTDNSGKNNGMYKHGKRAGKNATGKAKLRKQVIERDGGNWCLLCGKPGPGLHLHRIVYGSQGGKYELDNCVQLCPIDHEKVHSSKKKWMPHLLDYVNKQTKLNSEK